MRKLLSFVAVLAILSSACAGPGVLGGVEGVFPPEPPTPSFEFAITAGDDATPLVAAVGVDGVAYARTDTSGRLEVEWRETWDSDPPTFTIDAPGFFAASATLDAPPSDLVAIRLEPVVLEGRVTADDGRALAGTTVELAGRRALTDQDGAFRIVRAEAGDLVATRPAWDDATAPWDGLQQDVVISMAPRMIRALRVSGEKAGDPEVWNQLLALADTTAVNAFVVDTKEENGKVMRDVNRTDPYEADAVEVFYDTDTILRDMDEHGIYKITRIVVFQDSPWARANPDLAARNVDTNRTWANNEGLLWLDPTDRDSWEYSLDLAVESCERGFDEIQFDYVRFPSDGPVSKLEFDGLAFGDADAYYGAEAQELRTATIAAFLSEARGRLNPLGCAVAADIFAITLESSSDEGIGQSPDVLADAVDVLSPMIYTYTYNSGWKGFDDPDDHAPEIVGAALDAGLPSLAEASSIFRPWIQRALLEDEEIRGLQAVVEDRQMGWMLWSQNTSFNSAMLPPVE